MGTENRLVVEEVGVRGKTGEDGQRVQITSYKINKPRGCKAQCGD